MIYTHRNGETEAPTVPGRYWFRGTVDDRRKVFLTHAKKYPSLGWMAYDDDERVESYIEIDRWKGEWWGPVAPPWEQSA